MKNLLQSQPVLTAAVAEVSALIAILVAFGVHLTEVQIGAISGFVVATLALAGLVYNAVTPVANPKLKTVVSLTPTEQPQVKTTVPLVPENGNG